MGTNPNVGKMPNRGMGRQIGTDDSKEGSSDQDENIQEISLDSTTDNQPGGGTNFQHESRVKRSKEV